MEIVILSMAHSPGICLDMGVSINGGTPVAGWLEHLIKMDDLGVPLF